MKQKIPAHIFFGIIAFTMITLAACTPTIAPPSTATATTAPTVPPTVTATPDTSKIVETPGPTDLPIKPVDVYPFCTSIGKDKTTRVPATSPVNIVWGWSAKTEEQVNDFLENSTTTITLDGNVIEGYQTGGIFKTRPEMSMKSCGPHLSELWKLVSIPSPMM